jgi:hypothetical protein
MFESYYSFFFDEFDKKRYDMFDLDMYKSYKLLVEKFKKDYNVSNSILYHIIMYPMFLTVKYKMKKFKKRYPEEFL